jgi:CRP-like cAMP-binding protein
VAKDVRGLREEAAAASAQGKHKRALAAYLELERLEPRDAGWAKRAGETYRKLGNTKNAIEAFERSADRYAQNGFLVQAIAVCKLILQIQPAHAEALRRLAQMNEQIGAAPTRAGGLAENNPALHENPSVAAIRRGTTLNPPFRTTPPPVAGGTVEPRPRKDSDPLARVRNKPSTPPASVAVPRTKSKPIPLTEGAPLESVNLSKEVPNVQLRDASAPGIHVIPIDENEVTGRMSIEIDAAEAYEAEVDEATDLDLSDLEEIPLPEPRAIGAAAQRALAGTPLFAGLPSEVLEALVENLALISLERGQVLFREGEPSDALYVVVEGELSFQNERPPRVELARVGPGSFIGEVALIVDQPRSATVTALSPAELLRIDRVTLSRVLADHGEMLGAILRFVRIRLVDRWMRTSPLFRPFDEYQRTELAGKFTFLEIDAGTVLLGVGARPDGLYIVLAGAFQVHRGGRVVATLGPGDLIGETALLSGGAFKSDVIAHGKSLALCLPAQVFREVIMTHPHVLEYIGEQAEHSRRLQIL